jgi:hypothetical protein
LLCLLALAGCGSGGSSTSTATTPSASTTTEAPAPKAKATEQPKPKQAQEPKPPTGPAPTDPNPLPNQGSAKVAPGVPTSKGGDNSIQAYGTEADSAERVNASRVLEAYLDAQAKENWGAACSYVNSKVIEGFGPIAKRPGGCEVAMGALLGEGSKAALSKAAEIEVLSMRLEGGQAFLVYRDGTGKALDMPMTRNGVSWLVGALVGIELVL